MFCKNCGKESADGIQFCASCGYDLSKTLPQENTATTTTAVKPVQKRTIKVPLIIGCVIFVALFSLYQIGVNATKPETIVKNHMTAYISGDYNSVYDSLELSNDGFTSKEQFLLSIADVNSTIDNKITSISIVPAAAADMRDTEPLEGSMIDVAYKVVYTTRVNPSPTTEIVMLTKKGKSLLLFDSYKVEPSKFVVQNYSFSVPVGVKVYFDEIELGDTFLSDIKTQKNDNDKENPVQENVYTIPSAFFGEHTITAQSNFIEDYETQVYAKNGKTESISGLAVKAELLPQMHQMAEKTLKTFFDGMAASSSFADISSQINFVPTQKDEISKAYDSFKQRDWSGFDSRTVTYTNISIASINAVDDERNNGNLTRRTKSPLSYQLGFNVSCDVEPKAGYILLGARHSERYFNMYIEFAFENGELKIYSVR